MRYDALIRVSVEARNPSHAALRAMAAVTSGGVDVAVREEGLDQRFSIDLAGAEDADGSLRGAVSGDPDEVVGIWSRHVWTEGDQTSWTLERTMPYRRAVEVVPRVVAPTSTGRVEYVVSSLQSPPDGDCFECLACGMRFLSGDGRDSHFMSDGCCGGPGDTPEELALMEIRELMGQEWSADTADAVAAVLRAAGYAADPQEGELGQEVAA